ncbi:MAG TPA: hypothetical protein VGG90_00105 [Candidatus Dormibacteraeota bacterium]
MPVVVGAVAGGVAGAVVFGAFIGLGLLLMSRVVSPVPVIVLAIAGAYAGWLLGVVVFGAVRAAGETERPA